MSGLYQRKMYRSSNGCCICRVKSSTSRFTGSSKYEDGFKRCFGTRGENRCGDICNPCVLLVKRSKKSPVTSINWSHVVDSRGGPGIKVARKMKRDLSPTTSKYKSPCLMRNKLRPLALPSQPPSFSSIPTPPSDQQSGYDDTSDKSDTFDDNESDMPITPSSSSTTSVSCKSSKQSETTASKSKPNESPASTDSEVCLDKSESHVVNNSRSSCGRRKKSKPTKRPENFSNPSVVDFSDQTYWKKSTHCPENIYIYHGRNGEVVIGKNKNKRSCETTQNTDNI